VQLSPNFDEGRNWTRGIIIHSTRSSIATNPELEYGRTIRYFMMPTAQAAAHRVIGTAEGQHCQMVQDHNTAWHAREDNRDHLGIELAQGVDGQPFSEWQYRTGAAVCADWIRRYGDMPIVGHEETEQGKRDGKSDPGHMWHWGYFRACMQEAL
jgi:N-acetyl-anhydromuramyl-L-alanine amidase AmpD